MCASVAIALGVLVAFVASAPSAYLFECALREKAQVSLAGGLLSVMFSFVALTTAILIVYSVTSEMTLVFGCGAAFAFLLLWTVEAVRAWRRANGA